MESKDYPHYAQINFEIDIFKISQDGSLDPNKLSQAEFESFNILPKAKFGIEGFNLDDCIQKLKRVLEGLHYE